MKDVNGLEDPFSNLRVGQTVTARVIAKAKQSDKKSYQWDLSLKPKMLAGKQYIDKYPSGDLFQNLSRLPYISKIPCFFMSKMSHVSVLLKSNELDFVSLF